MALLKKIVPYLLRQSYYFLNRYMKLICIRVLQTYNTYYLHILRVVAFLIVISLKIRLIIIRCLSYRVYKIEFNVSNVTFQNSVIAKLRHSNLDKQRYSFYLTGVLCFFQYGRINMFIRLPRLNRFIKAVIINQLQKDYFIFTLVNYIKKATSFSVC